MSRYGSVYLFLFGIYTSFVLDTIAREEDSGRNHLAADFILMRIVPWVNRLTYKKFPPQLGLILGAIGVLIYGGTGLVALLAGGNFLDYSYLPIPGMSLVDRRYYGILFVEIGVALGVFGVLLSIFDSLTKEK
jgi:multicomponent Na+:H+ antiporter subunit B